MKKLWLCIAALLLPYLYAQMDMPDPVDAELVSEQQTIEPGKSFWVSVTFKIEDHWHTYWRNPGSSGLPTTINWTLPKGVTASGIHWATPQWIDSSGLVSLAYEHEVAHLVEISVDESFSEKTLQLSANVDWLVCTDVGELAGCYPGNAKVTLSLPVSQAKIDNNNAAFFKKAREQLPKIDDEWQLLASRNNSTLKIFLVKSDSQKKYENITFFPHQEVFKLEAKQKLSFENDVYVIETTLADTASPQLAEISGDIMLEGKSIAVSVGVVNQQLDTAKVKDMIKSGAIPTNGGSASVDIFVLLLNALFAFLGGIILNAMPCVLPVISLKIFGFIEDAGGDKSKIWKSGLAFTAGVLVSFWVLVGLLFAIRDFGLFGLDGAGWGYQLQSPTFVMVLVIGLVAFSLNLFGIFEIGTSLTSLGSQTKKKSGLFSSFATGILTTIIATPCSAPFMATAIGFALAQTTVIGFAIFTSMALGLAFPYLTLSIFPGWLKVLPKPGRWMESFKKLLAFPMLGTAAWQFSILVRLVANDMYEVEQVVFYALFGALFISMALWTYGRWGMVGSKKRAQAFAYSFLFLAVGIFCCHSALNPTPETWVEFSPQKVEQLTAQDKPVFIDFTATWCITCQANKKAALRTEKTTQKFKEYGVVTMTADWTKRNKVISDYLQKFERNSVPLYLLYHGKSGEYTILPQLLTNDIVISTLEEKLQKKSSDNNKKQE